MCWRSTTRAATLLLAVTGCNAGSATPPSLQPPAAPAARDSAANPAAASQNQLAYAGRFTQTTTYINGPTLHAAVRVAETISAIPARYGHDRSADFLGTQTWTNATAKNVIGFAADVAEVPSQTRKGSDVTLLSVSSHDSTGLHAETHYAAGAGVFNQLPEVPYARWTNTAARTQDAKQKGNVERDTYAADGSYTASARYADRKRSSINAYADGAANYEWPLGFKYPMNATIAFDPPSKREITVTFTNPANFPGQTTVFTLASWYPSQPVQLASDSFQNLGSATAPNACAVPSGDRDDLTRLVETRTSLDVALGFVDTRQRTFYWSPANGLVCETIHDRFLTYYFFPSLWFSTKPIAAVTIDGSVALQSGHLSTATLRDASVALPLDLQLDTTQTRTRLTAERQMLDSLHHIKEKR